MMINTYIGFLYYFALPYSHFTSLLSSHFLSLTHSLPPSLLAQADNYSDSAVGISLVHSSIELSQQTVESWNKVWGDVVNPSGAL
ncbi:MAG: hypothetical protein AAFR37_21005, partial [Cyanobacteria bacterium J06628_3]